MYQIGIVKDKKYHSIEHMDWDKKDHGHPNGKIDLKLGYQKTRISMPKTAFCSKHKFSGSIQMAHLLFPLLTMDHC